MGSAYSTMAADAIARFHRLQGKRVTLVTGRFIYTTGDSSYTSWQTNLQVA